MEITKDLAEVAGTLIGDGSLSRFVATSENRLRHQIAFTGSADELSYYANFVQPVIIKYFGVRGRLFIRKYKSGESTRYYIFSRKVFEFFNHLGIPYGKKSHIVFIPDRIFEDKELLRSCLRGLWDTDGTVYRRYTKQYKNHAVWYSKYLTLEFKTASEQMVKDMKRAFDLFGIKSNKILKNKLNIFVFRVNTQSEIQKFLDVIGFRNSHHLNRLARFRAESI